MRLAAITQAMPSRNWFVRRARVPVQSYCMKPPPLLKTAKVAFADFRIQTSFTEGVESGEPIQSGCMTVVNTWLKSVIVVPGPADGNPLMNRRIAAPRRKEVSRVKFLSDKT